MEKGGRREQCASYNPEYSTGPDYSERTYIHPNAVGKDLGHRNRVGADSKIQYISAYNTMLCMHACIHSKWRRVGRCLGDIGGL